MKISELFQRLSYGELSNLSVANEGNGTIQSAAYPKLIGHVNEALLRLHSRLVLRETSLLVVQIGNVTQYPLTPEHTLSSTVVGVDKFIDDSSNEFLDDVIKILRVEDQLGYRFPLNDDNSSLSMFTPLPNTLQIPVPQDGVVLSVTYQARHPKLIVEGIPDVDLLNQEFDVPFTLEAAIQNYIAYLVFRNMNGPENISKSQECLAAYEMIIAEITTNDLANQSISVTNERFDLGGWI